MKEKLLTWIVEGLIFLALLLPVLYMAWVMPGAFR